MIKINGIEHDFRFSYKALKLFTKQTGLALDQINTLGLEHMDALMWCGLKSGAEHNKKKFELTISDCEDLIDNDIALINSVTAALTEDMAKLGEVMNPKKKGKP